MIEQVDLGRTGLKVSRLCFGTGTNGWNHRSNQSDLGVERLSCLLRFAHERGLRFWDTADQYGTHPHVVAARINYAGCNMDAGPDQVVPVLEEMAQSGKGVYGMKIMGGGELAEDPARGLRFALQLRPVHALVVGMMDEEQIEENLSAVEAALAG